ncbi:MAG: hypothetical protein CYPHOPRED_005525 [Cyphobasidiales sp. Tagirdzhanova-0007]|nr:MAG: hypothetical protein CYPHOPRED_005525 [Cyphobasidiales sp. Tagirdzhanova-0007]
MKLSTFLLGASATAVALVAAQDKTDIDTTILQFALTLEHLEATFYKEALAKFSKGDFQAAGYPANVRQRIAETAMDEATHVITLESVLTAGGAKPTEACQYSFPYTDVTSFLGLSSVLEGVGVTAYLGAAALITSPTYLTAAAAILTVEARHQAEVSTFLGEDGSPNPFDTPLSGSDAYTLASAFITSCPSSNPTLPFKAFPALKVNTKKDVPGKYVSFHLPHTTGNVYMHFLNGLTDTVVQLDNHGHADLPAAVTGTVYCVASTSATTVTDANTVAGPAIIVIENPNQKYSKKGKRSIEFDG